MWMLIGDRSEAEGTEREVRGNERMSVGWWRGM